MQKTWMASQDTENCAYIEWIDVEDWEDSGKDNKGEKKDDEKP
jgi:hypothetical protein